MDSDLVEPTTETYIHTLATDEREHIDKFVAYPKTLAPTFDIEAEFPMLQPEFTTILHPRRVQTPLPVTASKIGGHFYWPRAEPWPYCDYEGHGHNPLVAVLQLRKRDVPLLEFPPGKNLFQMLWCPSECHGSIEVDYVPKPRFYWRSIDYESQLHDTLPASEVPLTDESDLREQHYLPRECALYPERVKEFPNLYSLGLSLEVVEKVEEWIYKKSQPLLSPGLSVRTEMDFQEYSSWSVSPSTKVGGYALWIQDHAPSYNCHKCGKAMEHLLSIASSEYFGRWFPIGESEMDMEHHLMQFGDVGNYYVFACRPCESMPTLAFLQCS